MRTLTLLFSFMIVSALALPAQQPIPSNAMPPVSAALAAAFITVQGCVLGLNGGYSLNVDGGKTYLLAGEDLSQFSGQKVRAVGKVTLAAKSGAHSSTQPTLTVSRVDKVADTCNSH
jgi:hypothetical protein